MKSVDIVLEIRNYFTGMSSNLDNILEMYIRSDFLDNICNEDVNKMNRPLVKRKYV